MVLLPSFQNLIACRNKIKTFILVEFNKYYLFLQSGTIPKISIRKYTHFRVFMNILDIIILICLIPALIQGLRKGFISQAISIISIIAGVWASAKFANLVGAWLSEYITASEQVLRVIAFAIILIGVFLALGLIARVLEKILKLVMLDWINKLLGAAFSIIKATLILGLIFLAVGSLNANLNLINPETFSNSVLYPVVNDTAEIIFPYLKSLFTLK